jgi:hypothetical protein
LSPIPECKRIWGVRIDPADKMTSFEAVKITVGSEFCDRISMLRMLIPEVELSFVWRTRVTLVSVTICRLFRAFVWASR